MTSWLDMDVSVVVADGMSELVDAHEWPYLMLRMGVDGYDNLQIRIKDESLW